MIYGRRGTGMDEDHLDVHIHDAVDPEADHVEQEKVTYERYIIDAYITFHDDAGTETTFSIQQADDLIEALNIIKQHHKELEARDGTL